MLHARYIGSRAWIFVAAACFLQCAARNTSTYSSAEQIAAVGRALRHFQTEDGFVSVDICEGNATSSLVDSCQDSFVIDSQGRGKRLTEGGGGGCNGGCPQDGVVVPVRITFVKDGTSKTVDGLVDFGADDGTSLDRPEAELVGAAELNGTILFDQGILRTSSGQALRRIGSSTCR